ncbi:hypothetical protein QM480_17225 [Flectobacillus sp. DC10W]|uniref:Uncharacterized protein n=1 Tax=Flectobacillus longus TaxID=2984207 RepID=A0ABT6YR77_9BACT|nr:hypothetical protein [Flectobacillus longus]MDI9866087.1 hypothetical protein [Flectobacillus longus]
MKSIKYNIPSVPRSVHDAVEMSNQVRSVYIPSVPRSVHDVVEVWHKYKDVAVIYDDICNWVYLLNLVNDSIDFFERKYKPKESQFEKKLPFSLGDTLFEFVFEKYKHDLSLFVELSDKDLDYLFEEYLDYLRKGYNERNNISKERSKDRQTPDKQFDEIFVSEKHKDFVSEKHKDFVCKMMIDLQIIDNDFNYIGRGKPSNRTLIASLIKVCRNEWGFLDSKLTMTELGRIFYKKMKLKAKRLTKSTGKEEGIIREYLSKNNV